jgi:hypothetical protein
MKKLFLSLLMMASLPLFAQPWKIIKGNGTIKKESRSVNGFTSLSSHGAINVQIDKGTSETIQVEGDENLLPYIETKVEDGKLIIRTTKNVNLKSRSGITVYVSMSKINSLEESGSGNIVGNGAFSSDGKATIKVSGSGNIKLNSGAFKEMGLYVSGSGDIDLEGGSANDISASVSGSGNIDCSNVLCDNVEAKISGSGNVRVNAKNSINASISGSGNVYYKGGASNVSTRIAGSGKAIKVS